ncbi:MAG: gamma-glutamylcyclotransferase family protein, partial [Pseudomonadota bacterium]
PDSILGSKMEEYPELLFIYGTLMAVAQHPLGDLLRENGKFVGKGSIQARLYEVTETDQQGVNTYPGAVPSAFEEDRVHGEVWRVTDRKKVFPIFDRFEACTPDWPEPYEFELRKIPVVVDDNSSLIAGAYLYAWDTSRAMHIPSGRYQKIAPDVR